MKKSYGVIIFCILALVPQVWIGCGDKATNPVPPLGTFKCDIDGNDFMASYETWAYRFQEDQYFTITEFGGTGLFEGDSVEVTFYMVEDGTDCPCIINFGGFEGGTWDDVEVNYLKTGVTYSTAHLGAHAFLYIKYPSGKISGTFNFVAYDDGGSDSIHVTNGAFNLQLEDITF